MVIRPVGAELFHAEGRTDGRTDMTKPVVAFRNFANARRNRSTMCGHNTEFNVVTVSCTYSYHRTSKC